MMVLMITAKQRAEIICKIISMAECDVERTVTGDDDGDYYYFQGDNDDDRQRRTGATRARRSNREEAAK